MSHYPEDPIARDEMTRMGRIGTYGRARRVGLLAGYAFGAADAGGDPHTVNAARVRLRWAMFYERMFSPE